MEFLTITSCLCFDVATAGLIIGYLEVFVGVLNLIFATFYGYLLILLAGKDMK